MRTLLLAGLVALSLAGCKEDDPYTSREGICTASQAFVQQYGGLVSPAQAAFGACSAATITDLGQNRWTISSYVDDTVFNETVRKTWSCTMRFYPEKKQWAPEETKVIDPSPVAPSNDSSSTNVN